MGCLFNANYAFATILICVAFFGIGWTQDVSSPPVCGAFESRSAPLLLNGIPSTIGNSPWHASLYVKDDDSLTKFRCSATVVHPRYILTAAHCVHDEIYKRTVNAEKLLIKTGKIFVDYDSPLEDPEAVVERGIKNVFVHYAYNGLAGNYASDIAVLEIEEPFEFSKKFVPACWDDEGNSKLILKANAIGQEAGPGRTSEGESNGILQTITVPYIPYKQCAYAINTPETVFVTKDKFCTSYSNETVLGPGADGAGVIFERNGQWYLMGIISVGVADYENGKRTWDVNSNLLNIRVSNYVAWILDVMENPDRYKSPAYFSTSQLF